MNEGHSELHRRPSSSQPDGSITVEAVLRSWPHWHTAITLAILTGSLGLFIRSLARNVGVNFGDEANYLAIADRILTGGLFQLREELRTYLYPFILCPAKLLFGASPATKAVVSVCQYAVFLASMRLIAKTTVSLTGKTSAGLLVFAAGALNPHLVQATTLLLTDILAACLVTCGLVKLLFGDLRLRNDRLLATLPFAAAVMLRPASAVFVFVACLAVLLRHHVERIPLRKVILNLVLSLAFFGPQLYMNVKRFHHFTPVIHFPLYRIQTQAAVYNLKFNGVVVPGERVEPLCHVNPWADRMCSSMYELAKRSPRDFALTAGMHIFGAVDWSYVDTYIRRYHPANRLPASFLLHSTWFLAVVGFIRFLRRRRLLPTTTARLLPVLVLAIVVDLGFLSTTQVESRFGYPVFLMALPFLGFSLVGPRPSRKALATVAVGWLVWLFLSMALSFWLDGLTGRIHWLAHLS
jgi:hypothetical protein